MLYGGEITCQTQSGKVKHTIEDYVRRRKVFEKKGFIVDNQRSTGGVPIWWNCLFCFYEYEYMKII